MEPELANLPTGFLQAIRDRPDDDAPRLIAADYLDENGHPEYAKYIRISCELERVPFDRTSLVKEAPWDCHKSTPVADFRLLYKLHRRSDLLQVNEAQWLAHTPLFKQVSSSGGSTWVPSFEHVWDRGFVRTVRCTLADWYGGVCQRCKGMSAMAYNPDSPCPDCENAGTVGGHGPEILRSQPVLEVVTEKRPFQFTNLMIEVPGDFMWQDYEEDGRMNDSHRLPKGLYTTVALHPSCQGTENEIEGRRRNAYFATGEAAMTALSSALLAWALTEASEVS